MYCYCQYWYLCAPTGQLSTLCAHRLDEQHHSGWHCTHCICICYSFPASCLMIYFNITMHCQRARWVAAAPYFRLLASSWHKPMRARDAAVCSSFSCFCLSQRQLGVVICPNDTALATDREFPVNSCAENGKRSSLRSPGPGEPVRSPAESDDGLSANTFFGRHCLRPNPSCTVQAVLALMAQVLLVQKPVSTD